MVVQLAKRRFNISQYHQMNEAGILTEDDRVELIHGEIIEMSPIGRRHATCVRRLINLLSQLLAEQAIIDSQNPIILNNLSEPQPDITLLKPRADFYEAGHPQPQDILLLIEVADSSIEYDREVKIPLYASSGISEVWLVDIYEQVIIVYCQPTDNGYSEIKTFRQGDILEIQAFPEIQLNVDNILG
ncbi:Uma2 family endonuclease [Sphaerospermopsis aphanizomenoides BCCUSP55]|uniref:Uma2 family endonuclease n=1 Tax=Sphaerospermopsis aphanizomenoides TaxID=459663 RepID=UPI000AB6FCB8|nr:Uma2 family endonuclease [Sphaerospermopsis aphanizomenoides]MBK1988613.1 Uma2 family endonuclease [Sphaerospermopsis aphanizomenoides BCCUSP55]